MKSNYIKRPAIAVEGFTIKEWGGILDAISRISSEAKVVAIDCYVGVNLDNVKTEFSKIPNALIVDTKQLFKREDEVKTMTERFMTDDVLFGYMTNLSMIDYFDKQKLEAARKAIAGTEGLCIVFGYGASLVSDADVIIYADMPRWEIMLRMRKKEVFGLGVDNRKEPTSIQHKRCYFNDWKVCDNHKRNLYEQVDYWLDTTSDTPKLIDRATFFRAMKKAATNPFRVVPLFDPAPWGGQWMKDVCDLDRSKSNFGWCFDCVPEENSLIVDVDGIDFEMPSINVVFNEATKLLGEPVEARFGKEFPIRFDFLDTVGGGNLSLQVHPTTQYVHDNFGIHYTQDESYYLLDAEEDAYVYIGVKNDVDKDEMINDLRRAQRGEIVFDVDKYSNKVAAKKHDHFLIPSGTVHCSGLGALVLEISSTPNLFTFKLWDWGRLGLDGKPRPINVERGKDVINFARDTDYSNAKLINQFVVVAEGDGWVEEKTGLHRNEFIETRRHTFSKAVTHHTDGSVHVLNLIEGREAIIESTDESFEPLVVHYAETFIIPASVETYTIRPYGESEGQECKTIKAYVRV